MDSTELTSYTPPVLVEEFKVKKPSPFDFVTAINDSKVNLIVDEDTEKAYSPFMTNRQLSYFNDTVLLANEMNRYSGLDHKMQFDFLRLTVPKRKRFSKWGKQEKNEVVDAMVELYSMSREKAREELPLLTSEAVDAILKRANHGGKRK